MESSSTSNNFARLLVFYHAVKRSKLNEGDLTKIVNKYKAKPDVMLTDLHSKYSTLYHFPPTVLLADVLRIRQQLPPLTLPPCLLDLLPPPLNAQQLPPYDPRLDLRAAGFDSSVALAQASTRQRSDSPGLLPCSPLPGAPAVPRLDNLSKAASLLPGAAPQQPKSKSPRSDTSSTNRETPGGTGRVGVVKSGERGREIDMKPLDRIALASSKHKVADEMNRSDGRSKFVLEDSPLALLFTAMQQRRRVRVIIRRVNSIRGTVDGYVRGFDKHFNLLLADVDETYTAATPRVPTEEGDVLVRHLPQLLVRGDNVVLVCFRDKVASSRRTAPPRNLTAQRPRNQEHDSR